MRLPTSDPLVAEDIRDQVESALLTAYRDGFYAALIAVSNAALMEPDAKHRAVTQAVEAAQQVLEARLAHALGG